MGVTCYSWFCQKNLSSTRLKLLCCEGLYWNVWYPEFSTQVFVTNTLTNTALWLAVLKCSHRDTQDRGKWICGLLHLSINWQLGRKATSCCAVAELNCRSRIISILCLFTLSTFLNSKAGFRVQVLMNNSDFFFFFFYPLLTSTLNKLPTSDICIYTCLQLKQPACVCTIYLTTQKSK